MKDAKGHGSDARGGAGKGFTSKKQIMSRATTSPAMQNALDAIDRQFAGLGPHGAHVGAQARGDGSDAWDEASRAKALSDWRDKGTSDEQVHNGIQVLFGVPRTTV